ncbi:hypothetical protein HYV10_02020 [Candidatus Dependentiae bacterium]|nr:hypothetical protein [Candidatus Dependentiae bacterium]
MNKNIITFLALSICGLTLTSDQYTTKERTAYALVYKIAPKDTQNLTDFNENAEKLVALFESVQRKQCDEGIFYNKILTFIKELQEAIVAGLNLFGMASTSTNVPVVTINEVAQNAETVAEKLENIENIENIPAFPITQKSPRTPYIEIILTISSNDLEKNTSLEILKAKIDALAEAFNSNSNTPEELVKMLNDIIQESKVLGSEGKMIINIAN